MSAREWKPGDVAMVTYFDPPRRAIVRPRRSDANQRLEFAYDGGGYDMVSDVHVAATARPLVVIDPEDREQVERLTRLLREQSEKWLPPGAPTKSEVQRALREFANPKPEEPTNPRAYVEDARENIWRLLADGDWVCTSGPDIGECIDWFRLTERYGPLTISGVES